MEDLKLEASLRWQQWDGADYTYHFIWLFHRTNCSYISTFVSLIYYYLGRSNLSRSEFWADCG